MNSSWKTHELVSRSNRTRRVKVQSTSVDSRSAFSGGGRGEEENFIFYDFGCKNVSSYHAWIINVGQSSVSLTRSLSLCWFRNFHAWLRKRIYFASYDEYIPSCILAIIFFERMWECGEENFFGKDKRAGMRLFLLHFSVIPELNWSSKSDQSLVLKISSTSWKWKPKSIHKQFSISYRDQFPVNIF